MYSNTYYANEAKLCSPFVPVRAPIWDIIARLMCPGLISLIMLFYEQYIIMWDRTRHKLANAVDHSYRSVCGWNLTDILYEIETM